MILCGQKYYVNIAYFIKLKEEYFTNLLGLENGTPLRACLSNLYTKIDSKKFIHIFIEWVKK